MIDLLFNNILRELIRIYMTRFRQNKQEWKNIKKSVHIQMYYCI